MGNLKLNKRVVIQAVLTLIISLTGVIYIRHTWIRVENAQSENVLKIARSIETTLPVDDIKKLEAKPSDIEKPQYRMIKNLLKEIIRVNNTARFAYIYTEQTVNFHEKLFINADSEPEDSKDYSPPGQEYTEAEIAYFQPFKDGKEFVTNPVVDRWGTWRSVFVPVKDTATGKIIAVFAMDFDANYWNRLLLYEITESSIVVVLLLIVLFISIITISKNNSLKNNIAVRKQAEDALRESEKRSVRQRRAIVSLAIEESTITGDAHKALQKLTEVLSAALLVDRVSVWSLSEDGFEMECICLYEARENRYSDGSVLNVTDFPVYFNTIYTESLVSAGDAENDTRTREFKDIYLKPLGITSMLDAGIWIEGKPIGIVCFEHIGEKRDWHSDEEAFANTAAAIVMQIFSKAKRKKAEKVILESEEKYKKLYRMLRMMCDNVPDLIWAKDLNRNFIFTNKAICEKLLNAKDTDEPIGKNDMFFAKRERESFSDNPKWHTFGEICRDSDSVVLESNRTEQFDEFGNVKGEFLFLDVYKTPFLDEQGNIIGIVGSGRDVTREKKLAEDVQQTHEELKESEEKFRNLAILTPFAIMIYQNDKWVYTNPAGETISGYSAEELYEMHFWDFVAPEYLLLVKERGLKRQAGETVPKKYEFKIIAKDGTEKWVYLNGSVINYHGKLAGLIAIVDITNLKQIEQDLIIAKEKAEEMSRLKSSFLANMSHELRTPLSGILGFSEILQDDLADSAQKEYVGFIRKSGKRLLGTLDLILNFAKLEAEKQDIVFSDVTLENLIHETVQTFSASAKAKNIYLKSIILTDSITTKSDEKFIRHILDNLVNNAIKFTDEGGVTIELSKENNEILIKVKDTGIGIAIDKREIIFEEFRQESEGLGRNFEGTGLGLSITKRFVELMKGTIEVESEVNAGSTFIVKFICEEAPETINEEASETITAKTKKEEPDIDVCITKSSDSPLFPEQVKYSILIVEDDEVITKLTAKILKKYYNVESALNGLEAIGKAKKKVHDIILMDINLSKGMNGIETLRKIRKLPGYEKTPAVALTAYVMPGDMEEFLAGGCTHYLDKPFTKNQLLKLISDIIESVK